MRPRALTDAGLLVAVLALFAVPLSLRLGTADEAEPYAGSDSQAGTVIQELDPGYRPWFSPWFEPSSGEVESGLFALQAAIGAGGLGFTVGRLAGARGRRSGPATSATGVSATGVAR